MTLDSGRFATRKKGEGTDVIHYTLGHGSVRSLCSYGFLLDILVEYPSLPDDTPVTCVRCLAEAGGVL